MVAPLHPRQRQFGIAPPLNLSRITLHIAGQCCLRGDTLGAAIRLRKAAELQLAAMAAYYDCWPVDDESKDDPSAVLRQLFDDGIICDGVWRRMNVAIELGVEAAECRPPKEREIYFYVLRLHDVIDKYPCGETFTRVDRPAKEGAA